MGTIVAQTKAAKKKGEPFNYDCFRIHLEWCGHGDLIETVREARGTFLWALFQAPGKDMHS